MESQTTQVFEANVHRILDGDTVDVRTRRAILRIRLQGIDCPEEDQPWGDIATAGLIKMIGGRKIRLETRGHDKHGRDLGTIFVQDSDSREWVNVNARMVMLGHAWVYRQYCDELPRQRAGELFRMERWARSRKVGLWGTHDPIAPWQWRHDEVPILLPALETELVNDRLRLAASVQTDSDGGASASRATRGFGSKRPVTLFAVLLAVGFIGIGLWSRYGQDIDVLSGEWPGFPTPAALVSAITGDSAQPKCRIKGNINWRGERVYHVPGTSFYDTAAINTSNGERWFCSEEEAVAAGWRAPETQASTSP